jgi:putative Mg2+ transporter-C (MgtC) family protein
MEVTDIVLRLGAAMVIGCALGLNRDLHGKPTGVRTLGLVGLGSAIAVLIVSGAADLNPTSRVIQGLVTGIGFLGAGVIVHGYMNNHVHGLTTAACAWLTACVGAACGAGQWRMLSVAVPLIFIVLIFGGPLEKILRRDRREPEDQ